MDNGRTAVAAHKLDLQGEVAFLRDQLRLTFDRAPTAQAVLQLDGCFEQVNDAMCELLGYSRKQLLARTMASISHPDDMAATLEHQRRLLSGHVANYQMEKRYLRVDGAVVWTHLSVAITRTRNGEPRMLGQLVDISEVKRSEARLAHEAGHTHLTDLPNRRLMTHLTGGALAALGTDREQSVALLFCNIDQFQDYSDSFGHALGDRLLVTVADRLGAALEPGERLGHFGGDKLLVLVAELRATRGRRPKTEVERVHEVVDRIRQALVEPLRVGSRRCFVTLTTGIALGRDPGVSADDLISEADTAMYEARRGGRDQVRLFDAALRDVVRNRWEIESELRSALDDGAVSAWFQPVVNLANGKIEGFEALAHWAHPDRGVIPPDDFIAIAERAGLIGRLGDVMLDDALQMAQRCDVGHIAVNVSPTELRDRGIVTRVADALHRHGVDPLRLTIEVTEQAVIEDFDLAASLLGELRELGVRVFIDDFGVGHSSLAQLTRLPIDGLKIDRSFVHDLDVRRTVLIEMVVDLARRLEFTVVAEGVETSEHVETLLGTGCTLAQGFRFAPALAPDVAVEAARLGHIDQRPDLDDGPSSAANA
ncbi:MAG: EAL domain-containing protein [Actinomycetota bacterium]|nr:EAL domain-containing protein [Actinomycetota bacterium]